MNHINHQYLTFIALAVIMTSLGIILHLLLRVEDDPAPTAKGQPPTDASQSHARLCGFAPEDDFI